MMECTPPEFLAAQNPLSLKDKTIVIKYGGNALSFGKQSDHIFEEIALLKKYGVHVVLIHGGGPQINRMLARIGIESRHDKGYRITDQETVQVAEMVLCGQISKWLVSLLNRFDMKALSLSGKDLQLFRVKPFRNLEIDLGYFGEIDCINTDELRKILSYSWLPVIAPVGYGLDGSTYMLDADHLAAQLAIALKADKLFILTNVSGILSDPANLESRLSSITCSEARDLLNSGQISGGMIPKLTSCIDAAEYGVEGVHIFNADTPNAIVQNAYSEPLTGTCITKDAVC